MRPVATSSASFGFPIRPNIRPFAFLGFAGKSCDDFADNNDREALAGEGETALTQGEGRSSKCFGGKLER